MFIQYDKWNCVFCHLIWKLFETRFLLHTLSMCFVSSSSILCKGSCALCLWPNIVEFFFASFLYETIRIFALDSVFSWSHVNFFNFWPPVTSHECACIRILCSQIWYSANDETVTRCFHWIAFDCIIICFCVMCANVIRCFLFSCFCNAYDSHLFFVCFFFIKFCNFI